MKYFLFIPLATVFVAPFTLASCSGRNETQNGALVFSALSTASQNPDPTVPKDRGVWTEDLEAIQKK